MKYRVAPKRTSEEMRKGYVESVASMCEPESDNSISPSGVSWLFFVALAAYNGGSFYQQIRASNRNISACMVKW